MLVCTARISSQSEDQIVEMRAIVTGKVHGIGFRSETKFLAIRLHLTGSVRNCENGSVEIIAQGPKEKLTALLTGLKKSFRADQIEDIKVEFYAPKTSFDRFNIQTL